MLVHGNMAIDAMSHNTQRILGKNVIMKYLFPLNSIAIPHEIGKIIKAQKTVILCHMFKGNARIIQRILGKNAIIKLLKNLIIL